MDQVHDVPALTRREREVLEALCRPAGGGDAFGEPATVREMAGLLFVSEAAIKQHLLHLYDKFGIWEDLHTQPRRVRLANEALRRGALATGSTSPPDPVTAGRLALASREWEEAFRLLAAAESVVTLSAGDLEALGEAAMWSIHLEESISALTRAHAAYLEATDARGATRTAVALAGCNFARIRFAVAAGWLAKAASLAEAEGDCPESGLAGGFLSLMQALSGQTEAAMATALAAQRMGRRCGDPNSLALGQVVEGLLLVRSGHVAEGNRRLDEAMASAAAGQLAPMVTAIVYCRTVSTCLDVFDFARAREWTEEIDRLEQDTIAVGFPGDCRTHRAELYLVGGRWGEGEKEAGLVCAAGGALELSHTITATAIIGEVRLRQGDLEGAAEAFARVTELGGQPEPGMSLLLLARGDIEGAAMSIRVALSGTADRLARARQLPAQVRIALSHGDLEEAAAAAAELAGIAGDVGTAALRASAAYAEGSLELARVNPMRAIGRLRDAIVWWREVNAPYETAQARLALGRARRALGDHGGAMSDLVAAAVAFEELGAAPDAGLARSLAASGTSPSDP